jgi:hypothetical protein
MTEIKPCPHCGAHLKLAVDGECAGSWFHPGVITDKDCILSGRGFLPEQIPSWNTRVPDPSLLNGLKIELVGQIAQFVADWNGATADGDTFLIAEEIREKFGSKLQP